MQENSYKKIYADLMRARTVEKLSRRIFAFVNALGFSDFLFVRTNRNWDLSTQSGLLCSMPDEWLKVYHTENLFEYDLVLSYACVSTTPIFSSQIYNFINDAPFDTTLINKTRQLIKLHKHFARYDHYCIARAAANGDGHVMLQISSEGVKSNLLQLQIAPHAKTLHNLCCAIDDVSTQQFHSTFIERHGGCAIRPGSLKILRLLASSDEAITALADQMLISAATARHHVAMARKALGVKTTIGAVTRAIKMGLINPEKKGGCW